jgi:FMN phosphatase YigB (HAD superfamily)
MKPSGEIIDKVYKIGMVPTNPETYKNIKLMSGVKETLDFLVEQDDELILYTRGPDKTQKAKIQAPHLDRWFKEQHIVNDKNGAVLSKIVSSRQKEKCCSVGDYLDCDILPALEIGIKAIYIPSNSGWLETGITKSLMANPGFLRFREILEIKQHYGKL